MPSIAADGKKIERGQRLRLTLDGTEVTVAWVEPDGCVLDADGDEWDPRDLEHMPPTDTERREVARRLRELPGDSTYPDLIGVIADRDGWYPAAGAAHRLADLIEPQPITGDTSDGYHTFDELYDHRARLFSVVVRDHRELAWKSRLHHDGTMYDGMFIVGVETPGGQATYHYDVDPYWGIFDCKELDRAPEWDGHTPEQAISRIASLRPSCDRDALLALAEELEKRLARCAARARARG